MMRSVLLLIEDLYEDLELWYPKLRLEEAGFTTQVAGLQAGKLYHGKYGYPCTSDLDFDAVVTDSFDALVIPGGYAPDRLRRYPKVLEIIRQMHKDQKPIAFICHAGWVPISAKILKAVKATGVSAIRDDLENAGAIYVDAPVVVDRHLISSRTPMDLPFFCKALLELLNS